MPNRLIIRHERGTPVTFLQSVVPANHRQVLTSKNWQLAPAKEVRIHPAHICAGEACVFHRPSGHYLRDEELYWWQDVAPMLIRRCPHAQWHYDPDSLAWFNGTPRARMHPADRFHLLPYQPRDNFIGADVPVCITGRCCGCCGPRNSNKRVRWMDTVLMQRRVAFKEWEQRVVEETRARQRAEWEEQAKRTAKYSWTANSNFVTNANLWINNTTTWTNSNPAKPGP